MLQQKEFRDVIAKLKIENERLKNELQTSTEEVRLEKERIVQANKDEMEGYKKTIVELEKQ